MQARFESISQIKLVGKSIKMSFSNNQTPSLWKSFMPHRNEIPNSLNTKLFSVEVYNTENFFKDFDPKIEFEKWAAVEVSNFENIPIGMQRLIIPSGKYAVFNYVGKGSEASKAYQSIFQGWFPTSNYQLDNRPHFAVMGKNYKNEDPNSQEELWFPIKEK
tara:strand:- start:940 stop:1422 length:483 start_codon:yes stop_codon:yes gene_type:complete